MASYGIKLLQLPALFVIGSPGTFMWPLIFCQHTIHKVIWPSPGTLEGTGTPY